MPSFPVNGPITATVACSVGHIEIVASTRDDVNAEVLPTTSRSGDASLAKDSRIDFHDGRLTITTPRRLNLFGRSDSVDVRIELPEDSAIDIESSYGSVRISGPVGDARIVAKYGNVRLDSVGALRIEAPYGEVEVAEVGGPLDLQAGHGHVRIDRVAGPADVRASHGSVDLGVVEGPVEAAVSGGFTIERALGDVTAKSAYGPIRIREVTGGAIRLDNGYAEVEVGVPTGLAAWIDASSAHGSVRNELDVDPSAAESERTVELRLHANWGDVLIRRASRR